MLNLDRDLQQQVGTIVLKRMGKGAGSTITVTSMQAPKEARQAYERGESSLAQRKFSEAEPQLRKAATIYPQFAAAWCLLGVAHEGEGRDADAVEDYRRSIAADPQFVNPHFALAALAMRTEKWADAVRSTEEVEKMDSAAFPIVYFYNAVANYNLSNLEASEKSVRTFLAMDANHRHPESTLLLAEILEQRHDYAGAAEQKLFLPHGLEPALQRLGRSARIRAAPCRGRRQQQDGPGCLRFRDDGNGGGSPPDASRPGPRREIHPLREILLNHE